MISRREIPGIFIPLVKSVGVSYRGHYTHPSLFRMLTCIQGFMEIPSIPTLGVQAGCDEGIGIPLTSAGPDISHSSGGLVGLCNKDLADCSSPRGGTSRYTQPRGINRQRGIGK